MNNERVTPKNAAKELQMDVITLRELMKGRNCLLDMP